MDFGAPYDTPSPNKPTFKSRSLDSSQTVKSSSQTHEETITHSEPSKFQAPNEFQTSTLSIPQLSSFGYSEDTIRELSVEVDKEHVQGLVKLGITPRIKKNPHLTESRGSTGHINFLKERQGSSTFNKIADTVLNHGVLKNIGTMTAITQQEEIVIKNCMRTYFRSENTEKLAMKFWFNRWGENAKIGRDEKDEMLIDLGRVRVLGEERFN
jgi:predicted metal-dependent phosphotriesterase family hydrolase